MNKSEIAAQVAAGMIADTETAFAEIDKAGIKLSELPDAVRGLAETLLAAGGAERKMTRDEIESAAKSADENVLRLFFAGAAVQFGVPAHLPDWIGILRNKESFERNADSTEPCSVMAGVAQVWEFAEENFDLSSLGATRFLIFANASLNKLRDYAEAGASARALELGIGWLADMTAARISVE